MKVKELLMNIRNKDFNLERALQVKKYIPFEEKKIIAQAIIDDSIHEENGVMVVDSVQQYLSYVKYMIVRHTNLDYGEQDYDMLCSNEFEGQTLLNAIMSYFEADAKECLRIMNLMTSDYMQQNSMEFIVGKFLNNLNNQVTELSKVLVKKTEDIGLDLDGIDKNAFNSFLNNYMK